MADVPALVLDGVTVRRGSRDVLVGVDATLGPGLTVLTGTNGSGKSSLLAAISGIVPCARGRIAIAGHDLVLEPVAARRDLGLLPERADAFVGLSARAWLGFVTAVRGADLAAAIDDLTALLGGDANGAVDRPMSTLSAGQRRKVALVAATCGEPHLLLLDEPLNALDDAGIVALESIVTTWQEHGRAVLCAMHRPGAWMDRASAHWHVDDRRVIRRR